MNWNQVAGLLFSLCALAIIYTYLGFPALLVLLARMRPPRRYQPQSDPPGISLLIAAYNEEAVIARKLENSLSLDYPRDRLQIIIAADGSNDQTESIARTFETRGVTVSYSPERRGKMAAINRAMPLARHEIVVFSDANNHYAPDTLRQLVAPFADPRCGVSTGAKHITESAELLSASEGLYWKYESAIKKAETRLSSCTAAAGEILAIRRELYTPPPEKVINDDFFIAASVWQKGLDVIYVPDAGSYEPVSETTQEERVRRTRIIAGRFQAMVLAGQYLPWRRPLIVWQLISHKFMRPIVPLWMIACLLFNLLALIFPPAPTGAWLRDLLVLAPPWAIILMIGQLLFYGIALLGNLIDFKGPVGKLVYLPTFLVNSNYATLLGLLRYLSGRQTVLWQKAKRRESS